MVQPFLDLFYMLLADLRKLRNKIYFDNFFTKFSAGKIEKI